MARKRGFVIKPPAKQFLPLPTRPGSDLKDTNFLENEVMKCCGAKGWGEKMNPYHIE